MIEPDTPCAVKPSAWRAGLRRGPCRLSLEFTILAFVALAWSSCGERSGAPSASKPGATPLRVQAYIVKESMLTTSLTVSGSVRAGEQTELRPETSGRVVALPLREGGTVRTGELLVKLFDADLQAQKKKAQVQRDMAAVTEKRLRELLAVHGTTQQELDMAHLKTAEAEADLEILDAAIAKTEVRAPYAGVVGLCSLSIGAYVTPQTLITTIRDMGPTVVDFSVPEHYAAAVRDRRDITFTVAGSTEPCTAVITALDATVGADDRSRRIRARVTKSNGAVLPGCFAT
ncbi:MAG: efflux RND transporter periplasmic adaptor subunit, partial [Candidatus Kapaibacterium sp.]